MFVLVIRHGKYLFNITEDLANLYAKPHLESLQPGFVTIDLPWFAAAEEVGSNFLKQHPVPGLPDFS
jgi:hypothetical protein